MVYGGEIEMTQEDLLKIIQLNPGIEQQYICKVIDMPRQSIGEQIRALAKKKEIRREYTKRSWKLYPT